jgi:hypothetical protein
MKFLLIILCLFVYIEAMAATSLKPPSFPASILEEQFPVFKSDSKSLADLRHHRQQLEFFREQSLEGYNRALKTHLNELKRFDINLEKTHIARRISTKEYESLHQSLVSELEKSAPTGEYMQLYNSYLVKYKKERDWVLPEIDTLEKERVKF